MILGARRTDRARRSEPAQHRLSAFTRFRPISPVVWLRGSPLQYSEACLRGHSVLPGVQRGAHLLAEPGVAAHRAVCPPERHARSRASRVFHDRLLAAHAAYAAQCRVPFRPRRLATYRERSRKNRLRRTAAAEEYECRNRRAPRGRVSKPPSGAAVLPGRRLL